MNADGSNIKQLTGGPNDGLAVWEGDIAWSPDGKHISFEGHIEGQATHRIYVMNVDGSNVRCLVKEDNPNIYTLFHEWSPDGSKIAFFSNRDGKKPAAGDIYVVDADGSNMGKLTFNNAFVLDISWSPDGRKIACSRYARATDTDIYLMDTDGKNQVNITNTPVIHEFCPVWSPDGTKMAFYSNRDGNYDIYVMNADGSGVQRLKVPVSEWDMYRGAVDFDWTAFSYAVEPAGKLKSTWGKMKASMTWF
jgi:TolB protein